MTLTENPRPGIREAEGIWTRAFAYHPFNPVLERAEGIYLYDEDGNRYIDASGGPMAVNLGHGDPRIVEAMTKQASKFAYCHPIMSNRPRAELCERISQKAPGSLNTTFLASGGSEAVESAIKLAREYHLQRGDSEKHIVISRYESYHGMSLGALSVAGMAGNRNAYTPMLTDWPHIKQHSVRETPPRMDPKDFAIQCARELEEAIYYAGEQYVAAFLATPLAQGRDYGLAPPPEYWQAIREICDKYDVLLIADEVITGWGRTGKWFGMEHYDVEADVMVTAKGIGSCYAPLAAVTVSDEVNEAFADGGHFTHGYTYSGHAVACAVGLEVIDIIEKDGLVDHASEVGAYMHDKAKDLLDHPTIADIRGQGMLLVPELVSNKENLEFFPPEVNAEEVFQSIALKNGLAMYSSLWGPRRPQNLNRGLPIFIAPALITTKDQVDDILDAIDRSLTELESELGVTG